MGTDPGGNAAEALVRTALGAGLELCLANPGTTEMPLVAALDAAPGLRPVLGLFEGVCTGAADGYARVAGRPALVVLHTGPGFANGIANLHNAARAHTPMVVVVGDQASWHRPFDPPLAADVDGLARSVARWVRRTRSGRELAGDFAAALTAALEPPGGPAVLIAPADVQAEAGGGVAPVPAATTPGPVEPGRVEAVAGALRDARHPAFFLAGSALDRPGLRAAARVAAATGARLICASFPARVARGPALPAVERLPYFPDDGRRSLAPVSDLVLVETPEPVTFFGYPGVPSRVAPEASRRHELASPAQDGLAALEALAEVLDAPSLSRGPGPGAERPAAASGPLDPERLGATLAAQQPEGLVLVDEALTSGAAHWAAAAGAPDYTHLCLTGGAIGIGMPCATGAALAVPGRPVWCLQADGSGMYTLQALWTQARCGLDVTTVVCANQRYRILEIEQARAGVETPGPAQRAFAELSPPALDWCALARGHGVPGVRVERAEDLARELARAASEPGPHLIEAVLPPGAA
ncbi:MAG: acetolactate synthase large subunit [Myxococcota bacterium]|nr:acetolactate synthase large subunit [Myxococcota bacterium]